MDRGAAFDDTMNHIDGSNDMRILHEDLGRLGTLLLIAGVAACASGGTPEAAAPAPEPAPAPAVEAAAPALPAAADLYDRMIELMGGRAAFEAYTSSKATGTFSMPSQGIEGSLEVYGAAPNLLLVIVDIPGIGTVRQGYNGEVGWTLNPMVGPMVLEGNMLNQMRQQADFFGPLNQEEYIASVETLEITDFDGRPCYKVQVTTVWDEEYFDFIDVETGLGAGSIRSQESPMGAMESTSVISDYRDFGGILTPTSIVQTTMGQDQVLTIESVEFDMVDESVFELPNEIKTMVGG